MIGLQRWIVQFLNLPDELIYFLEKLRIGRFHSQDRPSCRQVQGSRNPRLSARFGFIFDTPKNGSFLLKEFLKLPTHIGNSGRELYLWIIVFLCRENGLLAATSTTAEGAAD